VNSASGFEFALPAFVIFGNELQEVDYPQSLQQRLAVELETTLGEPIHFCIPHAYYNKLVEQCAILGIKYVRGWNRMFWQSDRSLNLSGLG
jgi:hypothetical protein